MKQHTRTCCQRICSFPEWLVLRARGSPAQRMQLEVNEDHLLAGLDVRFFPQYAQTDACILLVGKGTVCILRLLSQHNPARGKGVHLAMRIVHEWVARGM